MTIPYQYRNLPVPGGGYATGFLFHPKQPGILYLRTDIGGSYRFDGDSKKWISLIDHVTMEDLSETYPIALAVDPEDPAKLYIACGLNQENSGVLAVSEDYGQHFTYRRIPVRIHGNLNGRGTGERLIVDRNHPEGLFFASQQEGLWHSADSGKNWRRVEGLAEQYCTFVCQVPLGKAGQNALLAATAGVTTGEKENWRGHSLYVSYDNGVTFEQLLQPESCYLEACRYHGLVAQRCSFDGSYLYVTYASTGRRSYVLENGYSCDSGDTIDGYVLRYPIQKDGIGVPEDITPGFGAPVTEGNGIQDHRSAYEAGGRSHADYGFSGISVSEQTPGLVIVSTLAKDNGDCIYRSFDGGSTWECILYQLEKDAIRFRTPYMKPEYNGGHSLIHWLSDLKMDPFCDDTAWFNTGTGVFRTENLKAPDCYFTDWCDGIEETVHLNVYSLPSGPVQVIDILGDLGGFAFEEIDKPCENTFADEKNDRYITCINADFSDLNPSCVVVTPRGNWTGKTKGGLILSQDYGKTFRRLPMPFGLSEKLDSTLRGIECPNVNSGWTAISPDCRTLVWCVADGITLPADQVVVSHDGGETFRLSRIYDKNGNLIAGEKECEPCGRKLKVFSDRLNSNIFYGFGEDSSIYLSTDAADSFYECRLSEEVLPKAEFGLIDCANHTEVRGEAGKSGVFYLSLGQHGLWKLICDVENKTWSSRRVSAPGDSVYRVGLGLGRKDGCYEKEQKAIYCNGVIDGSYGFYRSLNDGESFERINQDHQMFGEIISIDGDCRCFGRFYLATGSRGLICGELTETS